MCPQSRVMQNAIKCPGSFSVNLNTLVELLQHRQAEPLGYSFLNEGKEPSHLTYQQLDRQARAIAVHLKSFAQPGDRVLLFYPPSLDYIAAFFGCLYAGIIAVPAYPPKRNRSGERLQAIANDANAIAVLTTSTIYDIIQHQATLPTIPVSHWITTESIDPSLANQWTFPSISAESLAFLQYTSGSTGTPKGVMVSHGNLMQNLKLIHNAFGTTSASFGVSWLPPYHDMGLIGGILAPLYSGCATVLMSPVDFLRQPFSWLQAISKYGATISGGPNFAYDLCVQKVTAEQRSTLDLSRWTVAFTGAEPIRAETLDRFAETFAPCGFCPEDFYPCYGMAESTLLVTGSHSQRRVIQKNVETKAIVGCGHPWLETQVVIVDPERLTLCADGEVGEIWTASSSVAQGYWNQPEKSEQTFRAVLPEANDRPFLRTGDLGFMQAGELYVTGRLKDVIIVRGQNHYPHDIEQTVEQSHSAIRHPNGCAAFAVEIEGEERLVIVAEVERRFHRQQRVGKEQCPNFLESGSNSKFDAETVVTQVRQAVAQQHGLQVYAVVLLRAGSLPKTSSGKIQRYACRDGFLSETLDAIAISKLPIPQIIHSSTPSTQAKADELIDWLRDYSATRINSRLIDERRCIPPHIVLDFGNRGLLGMQVPKNYGGIELGHTSTLRILEQLGAIDSTLALFTGLNNVLGIRPILQYGSDTLKSDLLPLLATGRELAAFAITEPGAGSNPQAIAAQAIPTGDGWQLYGTKIWSGSAAWAGVLNIFVKQQDSQGKSRGISAFAVRQGTLGLRQGAEALTMGMRGMVQNAVHLEGVRVGAEQQLGIAGAGMTVAQDAMMYGRLSIAAACIGGMKRCAQMMMRYAERRTISTGRLLENPLTLMRLSDLTAAIAATEALVYTIAERLDAGATVPVEAYTVCKTAAPEFLWQATDHLVQMLGGRGYIETNIAPQLLRDARILRIFEGPTETLNLFLGSRVMHEFTALSQFLQELKGSDVATKLKQAVEQLFQSESNFSDRIAANQWKTGIAGELATWAVLWVVSRARNLQGAATWAQLQFEKKLAETNRTAATILLQAEQLTHITAGYCNAIGDIEQTLAGEDQELDLLLRKQAPEISSSPAIPSEPQANQTSALVQSWIQTWIANRLGVETEAVMPERSLLDYGLDSVTAQEFVYALESWLDGSLVLESSLVWQFPTISDLANHLASEIEGRSSSPTSLDLYTEAVLDPTIQPIKEHSSVMLNPKAVFLTGATGFLGAFLLQELLDQTSATFYCLVRATDSAKGLCRIQKNLESYQLWSGQYRDRIVPILGDLAQPRFGLSEAAFTALADTIDVIYHSGAFLNWVYPYAALKPSNVLGTQEVIRLACLNRTKPLHYVSTTAVLESSAYAGQIVDESEPLMYSEGMCLGYSQSKWVAERLVTIAQSRGLPVTIYRPPLISGHSQTGAWNTDDFTCRLIQGCLQLGAMAELDYQMDLAPVDYVSQAIAYLSRQPDAIDRVFHLNNPQPLLWSEFIRLVQAAGYPIQIVSYETWLNQLQNAQSNVLKPLLPFFLKRWDEHQLTLPQLYEQSQKPKILNQQTQKALSKPAIHCAPLDATLIQTYFTYLKQQGLLPEGANNGTAL